MYAAAMHDQGNPSYRDRVRVTLDAVMDYRGLTPEELHRQTGAGIETVRRWRRGTTVPSAESVSLLALALDAPLDLLLYPPATRAAAMRAMVDHDEAQEERRLRGAP